MGGVHLVGTEDTAGADDTDGGLAVLHDPDLGSGGLGAEHQVLAQIEGVLHIPGGMVLGHVEGLKAVVVGLHLGAVHHVKAHGLEDVHQVLQHDVQGMQAAGSGSLAGQGDVQGLLGQLLFQRLGLKLGLTDGESLLQSLPDLVGYLTHNGAFLGRELAHLLENGGQLTLFTQILDPQSIQLFAVLTALQSSQGLLLDVFQLVAHKHFPFCERLFKREKTPVLRYTPGQTKRAFVPHWDEGR